jgi:hypothetical protein
LKELIDLAVSRTSSDDGRFPNWTKLEFYDGVHKLGDVTKAPAQLAASDLPAGLHVFSVLGPKAQSVRPAKPVLVIVGKLPTAAR